jgi:membrane protein
MYKLIKETIEEFIGDECMRFAASLAFYSLLSLPAVLVLVLTIVGMFVEQEQAVGQMQEYMHQIMGEDGAEQLTEVIRHVNRPGQGQFGWIISLGLLLVSASAVLSELQAALNKTWQVKPDPEQHGMVRTLIKRALSLVMVLAIAALLIASLLISWLIGEFAAVADAQAPGWISPGLLQLIDQLVSLAIVTVLFAAVFKFLPDVQLAWMDVWVGALITALLFVLGKFGVSLYFSYSDPTEVYGAAGSLALVLLWIYYSAVIFFLGAEFTQVYARTRGRRLKPAEGAIRDETSKKKTALDCNEQEPPK